ncbi:site-specific integrase [Paenibacillus glycanilyticus]|uniref:site-specific integrase n=1 Tax=Paenibacillus glycanilyticus TaxID=126569 RepID=UPI000FDAFE58|nr:site-specific integrase [Paenibacillus glycanilyticus]
MANFKKHGTGWEYRLKFKDPFTQEKREKSARGFKTKREAELAAAEFMRKFNQGYEKTDMALVDFLYNWIDVYKRGVVRKNTIQTYLNSIDNHIKPYFIKLMVNDLKPDMYQKFLDHCIDKGLGRRSVEIIHSTVYGALERAVIQGKLERNPCKGSIIKAKQKRKDVYFIDSNEIPSFLQAAHNYGYIYWIFFKLMIETGVRKGEAAAIRWRHIDFVNQTIQVEKTLDFTADDEDEEELFGETKTEKSDRIIKISSGLVNDLKFHAKWQEQNKQNLLGMYRHDLELVLCRKDGKPMPKSSLFNAFSRILKRADLPSLPIHSLRHTCAVLMLEAGADMKFVQEQLGHGSIQITSDVYSHISKKLEQRNMEKIDEYKDKILGGVWGAPLKEQ